ncbi:MAG: prepilin-type N-terminal cleavage/methylation domain-containing protein [Synergistaceae bacterium]|nr:prepilin-type N-terminal cleavage/methylation domain-containing protein [Synergistaceae bacterium]
MKRSGHGFTLMEVLVATAIAGLVITAGFRLMAMSYRLLGELHGERELISAAQYIWLRFRTEKDMPSSGTDDKKNVRWRAEDISVSVEDYELKFRKVTVTISDGRSMSIYVTDENIL